jgi:hypothetical protein
MKNDYTQILIDIQKKSRITVQNVKDIKNLKDEIESGVTTKIGYNTMRRLFGFLPKTVPSHTTLTILSNYLGYTSYSSYINNKLNFDEWYFQQKLINYQLNNQIDSEVTATIEAGFTNKNNIVAVANYIAHYIYQRKGAKVMANKHHHFIVSYNKNSGWTIDIDSEEVRFPDGTVFNYDTTQWENSYIGDGEYNDNNDEITGTLGQMLEQLNGRG